MAGKGLRKPYIVILFLFVFLAALVCFAAAASADDAEQLKYLPGRWAASETVQKEGEEPQEMDILLTLGENGEMSLSGTVKGAEDRCTYSGTWSSEFVPDAMDRLTLRFTATDNPLYAESGYSADCIFDFYTESWVENDTWNMFLLLESSAEGSLSPFDDLIGYGNPALHREQAPNMRVANCKNYVSLRAKPATSSARLAKVPLGALVLALPGAGEQNGFVWCTYHDEYGYILAAYLQPVE